MTLEERAIMFATAAHGALGQVRRYSAEPYISHPLAVMELVRSVPHDEAMLAAAALHDTIEDTRLGLPDIERFFGDDVACLVQWLTDADIDGNRAFRKATDRNRLSKAPARAQTIKVADLIHNSESIVANDPKFAAVYIAEKRALLDVMLLADPALKERARRQIRAFGMAA